jgi:methionyl-tRNA formyltransferase
MRIIFLGTPDFAVATLDALVAAGMNVVAVVTAPDKPSGRGLKLKQSAVADAAEKHGIPTLKPEKLKNPLFLDELKSFGADVQVVVAFRMLPEVVWNMPPLGTYNLHGSLLPDYRGAAPINHAIINGETITGVTTFKLIHAIDQGAIALQKEIPISENQTAGELHDEMMHIGAGLMVETLKQLQAGTLVSKDQSVESGRILKEAPKLNPAFCSLKVDATSKSMHDFIRGLSPYPGVSSSFLSKGEKFPIKLYKSQWCDRPKGNHRTADVLVENGHLYICSTDGFLEILELQPAGKRRMTTKEFLNGFKWEGDLKVE